MELTLPVRYSLLYPYPHISVQQISLQQLLQQISWAGQIPTGGGSGFSTLGMVFVLRAGLYAHLGVDRPVVSGLTNLTNTPEAHQLDPAWSNGGDAIAFNFTDRNSNRFMLKTMAPDGTNVRTVYSLQDSAATAVFPAGVYDLSWSQDAQWILVEEPVQFSGRGENGRAGLWRLLKVRADGADVVDLTSKGAHGRSAVYASSFSPDGESILFTSRYGPEKPSRVSVNIFTIEANGRGLVQLTSGPH